MHLKVFSQSGNAEHLSSNLLKFDFSGGTNIDIPPSKDDINANLLGSRAAVVPFMAFKATHLFSKRFGWYAGLRIDLFKERKSESFGEDGFDRFIEDMFGAILAPFAVIKPALDGGVVYRLEGKKWSLYPNIGLGYTAYGVNRSRSRTIINDLNQKVTSIYTQNVSFITGNAGLSANYFIKGGGYFMLSTGIQYPLQSSSASFVQEINGRETARNFYRTSDAGRNLYIGIGYGVLLDISRRR